MPRRHRRTVSVVGVAALLLVVAVAVPAPTARASGVPVAPLSLDRALLSNLTAPSVVPGGSSSVGFRVYDPAHFGELSSVVVTLQVYELNGYPGDAVGPLPVAGAPVLENGSVSGESVNLTLPTFLPRTGYSGSVPVATSASTPAGTYAIRTALAFTENNTTRYRFESRGWFTLGAWENATEYPNGTGTVNASRLNVSGIVPETAIYVAPSGWPVALGALVAGGLVLVGLGTWLYFRRGPGSRSGAEKAAEPGDTNAPSALGRSRSSPGDSRSN